MNLYEINKTWDELQVALQDSQDVELQAAIFAKLDEVVKDRDEKLVAYCSVYKNLKKLLINIEEEVVDLKDKHARLKANMDSLLNRLKSGMTEDEKFTNGVHSIGWRKSEAVIIDDEATLPKKWQVKKVTWSPDKVKINLAIASGKKIKQAHIEHRNNIQIK